METSKDIALTFGDIKGHRARLLQDPQYSPSFKQIVMLSDVDEVILSNPEIADLAGEQVLARNSPRAIVATLPLLFGLSRMFEAYADRQLVHVFRSLDDAAVWTDVPKEVATNAWEKMREAHKPGRETGGESEA